MSSYNPDFWEIPTDSNYLENIPNERSMWWQTEEDQKKALAMKKFFLTVKPAIEELIASLLTKRQREVITLYYFMGKTQNEIGDILNIKQSTVSRCLWGTCRQGKKVGGAIPKLKRAVNQANCPPIIFEALEALQKSLAA